MLGLGEYLSLGVWLGVGEDKGESDHVVVVVMLRLGLGVVL